MGEKFNATWIKVSIPIVITFIIFGLCLALAPGLADTQVREAIKFAQDQAGPVLGWILSVSAGLMAGLYVGILVSMTAGFVITAVLISIGGSKDVRKSE